MRANFLKYEDQQKQKQISSNGFKPTSCLNSLRAGLRYIRTWISA